MITTAYVDDAWWRGYDYACYRAALGQGLAPMALRLAAAKIPFWVEQTGGFCMTIGVGLTNDRYIWVTNARERIEPDTTVDDLRWYACEYRDDGPDVDRENTATELTDAGTCQETAAVIAEELRGSGVDDVTPDVEGSQTLYRDAYAQGLAPMAVSLTINRVPFTVERPDGDATVLQIPLTPETRLWVTSAGGAYTDETEELRWSINLGEPVTTAEALA
ncbi:hypothetical protein AB0K18_42550, partial [Nonomuraea sp. NPDC049421]|uniref:hypothetical protein n=1 Tax=Nonomuraea sp. NPDC049421 TaxID=3155275 RepID=UPI0034476428